MHRFTKSWIQHPCRQPFRGVGQVLCDCWLEDERLCLQKRGKASRDVLRPPSAFAQGFSTQQCSGAAGVGLILQAGPDLRARGPHATHPKLTKMSSIGEDPGNSITNNFDSGGGDSNQSEQGAGGRESQPVALPHLPGSPRGISAWNLPCWYNSCRARCWLQRGGALFAVCRAPPVWPNWSKPACKENPDNALH